MSNLSFLRLPRHSLAISHSTFRGHLSCNATLSTAYKTLRTPFAGSSFEDVRRPGLLYKQNSLPCFRLRALCPGPALLRVQHHTSPIKELAKLDLMKYVFAWYVVSKIYSSYNKKALLVFPHPWLLSLFQLVISATITVASWTSFSRQVDAFAVSRALVLAAVLHAFCHVIQCASNNTETAVTNGRVKCLEALLILVGGSALGTMEIKSWLKTSLSVFTVSISCAIAEVEHVSCQPGVIVLTSGLVVATVLRGVFFQESLLQSGDCTTLYGAITVLALLFLAPLGVLLEGRLASHTLQSLASTQATVLQHLMAWVIITGITSYLSGLCYFHVLFNSSLLTTGIASVVNPLVCTLVWGAICSMPMLPRTAIASYAAMLGLGGFIWAT